MITLDEAVSIARKVEVVANMCGHYVALAGGCLWRGHSENDIDLIIYPHRGRETSTESTYLAIAELLQAKIHFQVKHETPSHLVIRLQLDGMTIDLFFIHEHPDKFKTKDELITIAQKYA